MDIQIISIIFFALTTVVFAGLYFNSLSNKAKADLEERISSLYRYVDGETERIEGRISNHEKDISWHFKEVYQTINTRCSQKDTCDSPCPRKAR